MLFQTWKRVDNPSRTLYTTALACHFVFIKFLLRDSQPAPALGAPLPACGNYKYDAVLNCAN